MEQNYQTPLSKIMKNKENCTPVKRAKYQVDENYITPRNKIIKSKDVCSSIKEKINNVPDITHIIFPKIEFDT